MAGLTWLCRHRGAPTAGRGRPGLHPFCTRDSHVWTSLWSNAAPGFEAAFPTCERFHRTDSKLCQGAGLRDWTNRNS
jgi:hypothetical protein